MTKQPKSANSVIRCPACLAVDNLTTHADRGEIRASDGVMLAYPTEYTQCGRCHEEFLTPDQTRADSVAAGNAIREHLGLLNGSQVRAIRERLGLTQAQFEELLGVGPKTVVRWERNTVCQSATADRLMRLVEASPDNVLYLRRLHGLAHSIMVAPLGDEGPLTWSAADSSDASTRAYVGRGQVLVASGPNLPPVAPEADAPAITFNPTQEMFDEPETDNDSSDLLSGAFAA